MIGGAIFAAAASLVPGGSTALNVGSSLLGGFGKVSDKDQTRINAAADALQKAVRGDASALAYMQQQAQNSATNVGKDAFKRALQAYADQMAGRASPTGYTPPAAPAPSPLKAEVSNTVNNVRDDLANGVLRIGTGATNTAASNIAGTPAGKSAFSLPTNPTQLLIIGGVAVGLFLILKKHH